MTDSKSADQSNTTAISDLARVRVKQRIGRIPHGGVGTVVHTYPNGCAYEVEFILGDEGRSHTIETIEARDLELVTNG